MATKIPGASSSDQLPHAVVDSKPEPLVASCHCGRVTLELPSVPKKINECRCTVCYKYGALWGYFTRSTVTITVAATDKDAALKMYAREDLGEQGGDLAFCRCGHCGCMTHWWGLGEYGGPENRMGVNTRMLPESVLNDMKGVAREITRC